MVRLVRLDEVPPIVTPKGYEIRIWKKALIEYNVPAPDEDDVPVENPEALFQPDLAWSPVMNRNNEEMYRDFVVKCDDDVTIVCSRNELMRYAVKPYATKDWDERTAIASTIVRTHVNKLIKQGRITPGKQPQRDDSEI